MAETYRIRYKRGDLEVEVESTDKNYVDKKLTEIILSSSNPTTPKNQGRIQVPQRKSEVSKKTAENGSDGEPSVDVASFVEFIKDSDKFPQVEKNVLKKKSQLARIIMVLYFIKDFTDNPCLSTGQIATITDQLNVRIKYQNVGKLIKANQKYFTGQKVRKPGAVVPYKLNRQGIEAFERCLNGEKL
jgi:hypothetical protein